MSVISPGSVSVPTILTFWLFMSFTDYMWFACIELSYSVSRKFTRVTFGHERVPSILFTVCTLLRERFTEIEIFCSFRWIEGCPSLPQRGRCDSEELDTLTKIVQYHLVHQPKCSYHLELLMADIFCCFPTHQSDVLVAWSLLYRSLVILFLICRPGFLRTMNYLCGASFNSGLSFNLLCDPRRFLAIFYTSGR